jgi:chemotaxis regulatin CheY-phosphate phosphatase CheZ
MEKEMHKLTKDINNYLAEFKNEQGEPPNPLHVALMIHDYCDLFISSRKK